MTSLAEFLTSAVGDASSLDEELAESWRILEAESEEIQSWGRALARSAVGSLRFSAQPSHLVRPERDALVEVIAAWYGRLIAGSRASGPWMDTCVVGLFLTAAGAAPSEMVAMTSALQEHFVERSRGAFRPAEAARVDQAFSRVLHRASAMMVGSHDALTRLGLSEVGVKETLVRRLPYISLRRLVAGGTRLPRLEGRTTAIDRMRAWLWEQVRALRDPRERHRAEAAELYRMHAGDVQRRAGSADPSMDEDVDVEKALREVLEQRAGQTQGDGAPRAADLGAELQRLLRSWLQGPDTDTALGVFRGTSSRDHGPN